MTLTKLMLIIYEENEKDMDKDADPEELLKACYVKAIRGAYSVLCCDYNRRI